MSTGTPGSHRELPSIDDCLAGIMQELRGMGGYLSGYGEPVFYGNTNSIRTLAGFVRLRDLPASAKRDVFMDLARATGQLATQGGGLCQAFGPKFAPQAAVALVGALIGTKIDLSREDLVELLEIYLKPSAWVSFSRWPAALTVNKLVKLAEKAPLGAELQTRLHRILDDPAWQSDVLGVNSENSKVVGKLTQALRGQAAVTYQGLTGDAFGDHVSGAMSSFADDERGRWHALFHHCVQASGAKPSKSYSTKADELIAEIGVEKFRTAMQDWLGFAARLQVVPLPGRYGYTEQRIFHSRNQDLLKGLLWTLVRFHDAKTLKVIADLALNCAQKVPGVGPVAPATVNACIYALANTKGLDGVAHLSRLKLRIRQNNTQKLIQKWIDEEAAKRGLKPAQIEEMAAPDFGMQIGERQWVFDDYILKLTVTRPGEAELQWLKPDGKPQKTVPAFVQNSKAHSDRLKSAKDILKQVKQSTTVQRDRIDRLYVEDMRWPYAEFQKYYLDHGLVSVIARRLIWMLEGAGKTTPALFVDGEWQDVAGSRVDTSSDTIMRLWHPIDSPTDEVLCWRNRLETLKLQQPLKQAHREVYLLTEAELRTVTYSNRMAAHILKQHQFNSLAALRGWRYSLLGAYDDGRDGEIARKELPAFGLRAEFWVDQLADGESFNDTGIWDYVATDQVRFMPIGEDHNPRQLVDIPKIVLSEIMRDCDLFVGVASVGNDPNWLDGGREARHHHDYWHSYSFGELSEMAKTRKSVLERLLPKLKIRDKTHIDGKFLIVDGKRHTYKIHIGSTNILIAPADRYLCIVPGRSVDKTTDRLFIPFEGDRGLSILLSKALMLAEDDEITDPSILSQLNRKD